MLNYNFRLFCIVMSLQAKIVLAAACSLSAGIIGYVHYKQQLDRKQLHAGVLRDIERRQRRKAENLYTLQQQIDITKELKMKQENDNVT